MDKSRKLRRYLKKDYSQVVDFPVEIVGRDGVVRRYSFEASVRLYQRRITSAPSRYEDGDLVEAEVYHCQRRIGQLRESYLHHYGWSSICSDSDLTEIAHEFAGEVVAFLRRFYNERDETEQVTVSWVEEMPHGHLFFISNEWTGERYLMYLFLIDESDDEGREVFLELLGTVRNGRGDGVERLIAFHHSADCALVLTGTELPPHEVESPNRPNLLNDGLHLMNSGELPQALRQFERALNETPYQRRAYLAAAIVADTLKRHKDAEMFIRMGLHYFPADPALLYHLGLAMFREGRSQEASDVLAQALELDDTSFPVRYLLGVLRLLDGLHREAAELMETALHFARPEDAEAVEVIRTLRVQFAARRWMAPLAMLLAVGAWFVSSVALTWALGIAAALVATFGIGAYHFSCYRLLTGEGAPAVHPAPPEGIQFEAEVPRRLV